ncbi:hypothetical protein HK100_007644 [Physocladia obscura]|uniref:Uncharacterized protein n=1 Tax=Physocladia obscura TaxID=109957 RepID=A0AAD5SQE3_9FUNG|nr:hypothetical protein HK100_007644 [Physocladia obscura]
MEWMLVGCTTLELDEPAQAFAVDGVGACVAACGSFGTAAALGGKHNELTDTSHYMTAARCLCVVAARVSACPNFVTLNSDNFVWPVYANSNSSSSKKLSLPARREFPIASPSPPVSSLAASSSTAIPLFATLGVGTVCVLFAATVMVAMTRGKSRRQTSSSSNANTNANTNTNTNTDIEMQRAKEAAAVEKIAAPKAFVDGCVTVLNAPEDAAKRNSAALPFHYPSPSVSSPLTESNDRKIRHQHSMPGFKNFFFRSSPLSRSRLSHPPANDINNSPGSGVDTFHLHHPRAGTSLDIIRPSGSSYSTSHTSSVSSRSVLIRHAAEEDNSSDHSSESHEPLSRKSSDIYLGRKSSDIYLGRRSLEAFGRKSHDVPLARNLSHKSSRLGRNVMRRPSEEDEDDGISISRHHSPVPQRSGSRLARAVGQLFGINNNSNQEILMTVPPQIRTFRSISGDTEETEGSSSYESSGTGRSIIAPIRGIGSTTSLIGRSDIVNSNINQELSAPSENNEPASSDSATKRQEQIIKNRNNRIIPPPPPFANISAVFDVTPDNASYTSTVSFTDDDDASSTRGIPNTPKALRTAISSASITSSIPDNNMSSIRAGKRGVSMASSSAFNESVFMVSSSSVVDEMVGGGGGVGRTSPSPSSVFMDILEENIRRDGAGGF